MRRTDRIRHTLGIALIDDPKLRIEAKQIAQWGLRGKPSARYIEWKHELNQLADELGIPQQTMLERVISQAVRTQIQHNEQVKVRPRKRKKKA